MFASRIAQLTFALFLFVSIACACIGLFKAPDYTYKLSIVGIFQNEERFLKEWIDFHRLMGVEHFYLFNHLSSDEYLKVLQPYMEAGIIELHDWPYASQPGNEADWTRIQSTAYRRAIDLAKGYSKWLAILDTDEFLFPVQKNNLIDFLAEYEECCGILVNWQIFGTSHIKKIPEGRLLIETLTLQSPVDWNENTFCKSIVRPEHVKYCVDPHTVVYYPWSYSLDPDKRIFPWKFHRSHPVKIDKIRINHYWSRDEEFFETQKIARNEHWGDPAVRRKACNERNASANQLLNAEILKFVPLIKGD